MLKRKPIKRKNPSYILLQNISSEFDQIEEIKSKINKYLQSGYKDLSNPKKEYNSLIRSYNSEIIKLKLLFEDVLDLEKESITNFNWMASKKF